MSSLMIDGDRETKRTEACDAVGMGRMVDPKGLRSGTWVGPDGEAVASLTRGRGHVVVWRAGNPPSSERTVPDCRATGELDGPEVLEDEAGHAPSWASGGFDWETAPAFQFVCMVSVF